MTSTTHRETQDGRPQGAADRSRSSASSTRRRERVYRAHTDPELVKQWLGPRRLKMRIEKYDIVRGGSYRYVHIDEDGTEYGFWGAVHDARPGELIVQTFGFDGAPDTPSFDKMTLEDLGGGRTRSCGSSRSSTTSSRATPSSPAAWRAA